jgi:hypothetical protein
MKQRRRGNGTIAGKFTTEAPRTQRARRDLVAPPTPSPGFFSVFLGVLRASVVRFSEAR